MKHEAQRLWSSHGSTARLEMRTS